MTKEDIRSDIELRLYKGKPSDDAEIDQRQIELWMDMYRSLLVKQYVREYQDVPQSAMKRYECIAVETENPTCLTGDCSSRYYIDLPVKAMDLENDLGVFRASLQAARSSMDRLHVGELDTVIHLRYGAPSKKRPAWTRIASKLYFLGCSFKYKVILVDLVPENTDDYADGDEYPIPGDLVAPLIDMAVNAGMLQLKQGHNDITNDGKE